MILRKNPTLALEILHRLHADDGRYTLHIASGADDRIAADAFLALADRMRIGHALRWDGAVPQRAMPDWHASNAVLLSTSLHESFGYAIAEAACMGCDLAVLDHLGADEFWPDGVRFATVEDACRLIRHASPGRWRPLVQARFSLDRQVDQVRGIVLGDAIRQSAPSFA
jgi:glycosyltransferase involved in cell wall biosynthesis